MAEAEAAFAALDKRTAACRRCTSFEDTEAKTVAFFDPPTGQKAASGVYCQACFALVYARFYRTGTCAVCRRDGDVSAKTVHPYANSGYFCAAHLDVARAEKAARNRADRAKRARRGGPSNDDDARTWETTSTYATQLTDDYDNDECECEGEERSHAEQQQPEAMETEPESAREGRIAALCTFLRTAPDGLLRERMMAFLNERPEEARATFEAVLRVDPLTWDRVLRLLLNE